MEAVLFDVGGVSTGTPGVAVAAAAERVGWNAQALFELVLGPDEDGDHPWHRLERGETPFADAHEELKAAIARVGLELDPFEVLRGTLLDEARRLAVIERVEALRANGVKTAIVTNNAREFGRFWRPVARADELYDVVIDSSEVGARKPGARIFEITLERLDVAPQRAAFLDDLAANVDGARRVGIHGFVVGEDIGPALAWLDAIVAATL